jgi:hypothetical protein
MRNFLGGRNLMPLRDHPKIQWPPRRSEQGESSFRGEDGILKEVNFIEPSMLLLSNEVDGKIYFAELYASTRLRLQTTRKN